MNYEPTNADIAMETFRKNFPLSRIVVYGDGMVYPRLSDGVALRMEKQAKTVIDEKGLPLEASLTVASKIFKRNLIINVKPELYATDKSKEIAA